MYCNTRRINLICLCYVTNELLHDFWISLARVFKQLKESRYAPYKELSVCATTAAGFSRGYIKRSTAVIKLRLKF